MLAIGPGALVRLFPSQRVPTVLEPRAALKDGAGLYGPSDIVAVRPRSAGSWAGTLPAPS
jgi:hypothetical protein